MKGVLFFILIIVVAFAGYIYYVAGIASTAESEIATTTISLADGYNKKALAYTLGASLEWTEPEEERFMEAMTGIQWDAFNGRLLDLFEKKYNWGAGEKEIFLTQSSYLLRANGELFSGLYAPGEYEILSNEATPGKVAELLVDRAREEFSEASALDDRLTEDVEETINTFVKEEIELLPDLIPLPPQDVGIKKEGGKTLLVFSTTYYNVGEGNLELIADPATRGADGDVERVVFQNIFKTDNSVEYHPAGTFLWHEEHLHYHFDDFIDYVLTSDDGEAETHENIETKSTFCVRDVSRINVPDLQELPAAYLVCGKERQGVTVGWGDTYFHTYADQNLNVTDLPSGTYKLSFVVNPDGRIKEMTAENNTSFAELEIDKERGKVEVVRVWPEESPAYQHVYKQQVFN